jgi:hypothetical protein
MKKNFASQPEVMTVITGEDLFTEINPAIIYSEDVFKPNPLQNFQSDSPKRGNYRMFDNNEYGSDNAPKRDWWSLGLDVLKTGAGLWAQSQQSKADEEQAQRAEEIARLKLEQERIQAAQQAQKSTTFRKYGVPLIVAGGLLATGLTVFIILRKK